MTSLDRYDTSEHIENQYEPGSDGLVLRNLLGITSQEEMQIVETEALWEAQEGLLAVVEQDQQLSVDDVFSWHKIWLESIYEWAGRERRVNVSKDGFSFAMAHCISPLMVEFEREQLVRYTPCQVTDEKELAYSLAEVHVELMLIHPFREGNGRLGRLLATVMALQSGYPLLDFSHWLGGKRDEYVAAVQAGMDRNYQPMTHLFLDVIESS